MAVIEVFGIVKPHMAIALIKAGERRRPVRVC